MDFTAPHPRQQRPTTPSGSMLTLLDKGLRSPPSKAARRAAGGAGGAGGGGAGGGFGREQNGGSAATRQAPASSSSTLGAVAPLKRADVLMRPSLSTSTLGSLRPPSSPSPSSLRPCTPGSHRVALRGRFAAARLTDQNVTLSEDVQRLSSEVAAHRRLHSRADEASNNLTTQLDSLQREVAQLKAANKRLDEGAASHVAAAKAEKQKLETLLSVAKTELAQLRQQTRMQEQQIATLQQRAASASAAAGADPVSRTGSSNSMGSTASSVQQRPHSRRLSLRPGTPLSGGGSRRGSMASSSRRSSDTSLGSAEGATASTAPPAEELYTVKADNAHLRARLATEQSKTHELTARVGSHTNEVAAYLREMKFKDEQLATLRRQLAETQQGSQSAAAPTPTAGAGTGAGAGSGSAEGDDTSFEDVLREEMATMRQSYRKQLQEMRAEQEEVEKRCERKEVYWKDQLTASQQRYLALQTQHDHLRRKFEHVAGGASSSGSNAGAGAGAGST